MNKVLYSTLIYLFLVLSVHISFGETGPLLIVHGGAGTISEERVQGKYRGMRAAVREGFQILKESDNVLDACEAAIRVLEDLSDFNAGCGSALSITGNVEMDAILMNGTDLSAGAVGAVRSIKNPISLARMIMERTDHVLLVVKLVNFDAESSYSFFQGQGAQDFAVSQGVELIDDEELIPKGKKLLPDERRPFNSRPSHGTVGCVAINSRGQIGAGTSTGGLTGKLNGRVGDAPIVGAGTLADDAVGGISATGHGEGFIRYRVASRVAQLLETDETLDPKEAAERVLGEMTARFPEMDGGLIAITKDGRVGFGWNSVQLAWAYGEGDNVHFGVNRGDHFIEPLNNPDSELPWANATCIKSEQEATEAPDGGGGAKQNSASLFFLNFFLVQILCVFY